MPGWNSISSICEPGIFGKLLQLVIAFPWVQIPLSIAFMRVHFFLSCLCYAQTHTNSFLNLIILYWLELTILCTLVPSLNSRSLYIEKKWQVVFHHMLSKLWAISSLATAISLCSLILAHPLKFTLMITSYLQEGASPFVKSVMFWHRAVVMLCVIY